MANSTETLHTSKPKSFEITINPQNFGNNQEEENSFTYNEKPIYDFFKRTFDIIASILALIILSPLFLVISIIIFAEDKGNPFFSQIRNTKDGKEFKMYKFRSMCMDAEQKLKELQALNECDGPVFKIKEDPRVTKVGKFIRKTSIDELPQLVNVLKGEMSLVGPRPPLPNEVLQYTEYQKNRLKVKGGLTCFWQISGRGDIPFDKWVELDLKYIDKRSFLTDIKILFKTVKVVLFGKGAY